MLHRSNSGPTSPGLLGHVLHTHRELAFVVGVADPARALVDAGDVLQDLGGALAGGHRGVVAVHPKRVPVVSGIDAHAPADHPGDVHADGVAAAAERGAHRVVVVDVGGAFVAGCGGGGH